MAQQSDILRHHVGREFPFKVLEQWLDVEIVCLEENLDRFRAAFRHRPPERNDAVQSGRFSYRGFHFSQFNSVTEHLDLAIQTPEIQKRFARGAAADAVAGPVIDARFAREPNKSLSSPFLLLPITEPELRPGHKKLARRAVL